MKRLSDKEIEALRAEYARGKITHRELAALHGVSRSAVSRLLAGERRGVVEPAVGMVAPAVDALLDGLELDAAGRVRAAAARALAAKVDATAATSTGTGALALPRLVDSLAGLVDTLTGSVAAGSIEDELRRMLKPLGWG